MSGQKLLLAHFMNEEKVKMCFANSFFVALQYVFSNNSVVA